MPFLIIVILISIHEIGHFIIAKYFGFDIDKIYLYPYGGISKFNLQMNVSLRNEFIVLIMGPIFQIIAFLILINIPFFYIYEELIYTINYSILIFNLLPIYPLDGGKLLNILFNYLLNFKKSFMVVIFISYLTITFLLFYYFKTSLSLNIIFMIFFLIYKVTSEKRNVDNYYNKFLLERYLNNYDFRRRKKIASIDNLYRDCSHIIRKNNHYYTEREILRKKFNSKY